MNIIPSFLRTLPDQQLQSLKKQARAIYYWVFFLALVNSALNSALLIFFRSSIIGKSASYAVGYEWLIFVGLLLATILVNKAFQQRINMLAHDMVFNFEFSMIGKIRVASFRDFEKFGSEKIYTALNDVKVLAYLPGSIVTAFNAIIMILCGLVYLFFVYAYAALFLFFVLALVITFYIKRNAQISKKNREAKAYEDSFYELMNDLLSGFRELKMSTTKSRNLYNRDFTDNRQKTKRLVTGTANDYLNNELISRSGWYMAIGVILYLFPIMFHIDARYSAIFLVVILYLTGPVNIILSQMPYFDSVKISLDRLKRLNDNLQPMEADRIQGKDPLHEEPFKRLTLEGVYYKYPDGELSGGFEVGPIDLTIIAGEIIFIIGGNGSGKSTFLNILTGLYKPTRGNIYFNGKKIDPDNYADYRNQIGAVFTNPYLFSRNYEDSVLDSSNGELQEWVNRFQLAGRFNPDKAMEHKKMSKGQQKRLALIYLLLEQRPLIVLDEWAAEQDTKFRPYFYETLLGEIRSQQKTIIAVTHDDHHFNNADRILKFEFGKVSELSYPAKIS